METEETSFSSSVPKCLQSSLENVEIIRPNYGNGEEMKLSKYFLENSVVLIHLFLFCMLCIFQGLLSSAETEQQSRLSSVPPCFLSSLEFVEIRSRLCRKRYVMKVARYFAKNSVMLKKFVYVGRASIQEEDLLALLWRSSICEIEVRGVRR